jgi:hypothetical protein
LAGILGALLEREKTGRGQLVETSLLRTGIYCLGWDLGIQARFDKLILAVPRTEELNPMVNCYRARDDHWFWLLGVEADRHFPKLCAALGRLDLLDDERFSSARGRRKNASLVVATLDAEFAAHTRAELIEKFDDADVWWAPVNTPEEVWDDPQAIAAGSFVDVAGGSGAPAHRAVASPITFRDLAAAGPSGPSGPSGVPGPPPRGAGPGLGSTPTRCALPRVHPDQLAAWRAAGVMPDLRGWASVVLRGPSSVPRPVDGLQAGGRFSVSAATPSATGLGHHRAEHAAVPDRRHMRCWSV